MIYTNKEQEFKAVIRRGLENKCYEKGQKSCK